MKMNEINEINEEKCSSSDEINGRVYEGVSRDLDAEEKDTDDLRLEDILAQVEYCIGQLENPDISLEDSFRYYEEGIRKLKLCSDKTAQIEQKMQVMNSQGVLEDF